MAVKKRSPKESLKSLSWSYIVLAVLAVLFGVVVAFIPDINETLKKYVDYADPLVMFETTLAVNVLIYVWYFWLARRYADGKSNGAFYTVLLALGVAGGIISFILGSPKSIASIDFIIDAVALYFVYKSKTK